MLCQGTTVMVKNSDTNASGVYYIVLSSDYPWNPRTMKFPMLSHSVVEEEINQEVCGLTDVYICKSQQHLLSWVWVVLGLVCHCFSLLHKQRKAKKVKSREQSGLFAISQFLPQYLLTQMTLISCQTIASY